MDSDDNRDKDSWILHLNELPYVCLWHICSFLPPEDLARLSRVNKIFNDVCSREDLWRNHSLNRWQFCNINQMSEGSQRWMRYFRARRRVEARMDAGRPTKDYRVKSLRGHETDITSIICLEDPSSNPENLKPPLLISLSSDRVVYAWDVNEAKPLWSLKDVPVSCISGNTDTVAVGDTSGHVNFYRVSDWSEVAKIPPSQPDKMVTSLEVVSVALDKKTYKLLLISYSLEHNDTGEIHLIDMSQNRNLLATLNTSTKCAMMSVKGAWLAATEEHSSREVFVWDLNNVITQTPPDPTTPVFPHVTLHLNNVCSRPLLWLKPGVIATCSTELPSWQHGGFRQPFPPPGIQPFPPPGIQPFPPPGIQPFPLPPPGPPSGSTEIDIWDVVKHIQDSKKLVSPVFNIKHMYDSKSIKMSAACVPNTVVYSNDMLVAGDASGCVRVVDIKDGKCLQDFKDHKAAVTDIYADSYRLLTCSKDFSIRVYRWNKEGGAKPTYKLESRYQLLGGSVALKTHDGFNRVLCQSGSCVGVAGNVLKLYTFIHQLE